MTLIACTKCRLEFPPTLVFFAPNRKKLNGLDSWCRPCNRTAARTRQAWRRKHDRVNLLAEKRRHRFSPQGREWHRLAALIDNHRRRAKHLPFQWTLTDWLACLAAWKHRCAYCKRRRRLEHDHVIPLSNPACPGTVPWNIVPSCVPCNRKKHMRTSTHPPVVAYLRQVQETYAQAAR